MNRVRKRNPGFTIAEKFRLIQAVGKRSLLWDLADIYHYDITKLQAGWANVAEEVHKPVTECKEAWSSLRESYRYHRRRDLEKAQQVNGDDYDPLQSNKKIEWQFAEAMSFLPLTAPKRPRPVSPVVVYEGDANEDEDDEVETKWVIESAEIPDEDLAKPESVESIKEEPKPKARPAPKCAKTSSKASVVDMLSQFLNETKHLLEQPVPKNATVLAYWDTLLTGMSPQNSQRAVFKVTEFLQEIAKKEKKVR